MSFYVTIYIYISVCNSAVSFMYIQTGGLKVTSYDIEQLLEADTHR